MQNVMIDLETLSTMPNAAFITVGACYFDPDKQLIGEKFYKVVDWDSAMQRRHVSASTLKWWFSQGKDAQAHILKPGEHLNAVLQALSEWLIQDCIVWGNGATFDIAILEHAYLFNAKTPVPWKFWSVRDVRTVVALADGIVHKGEVPFEGTRHHALHDAVHQARYVSKLWAALRSAAL